MIIKALGIDIAKNVFQLHGVDERGKKSLSKKLKRSEFSEELANIPACQVYLEACGGAHHWARTFASFGHEVHLISPQYVKPFVKRNKNDKADAEAIVTAGTRPEMHFVRIKTQAEQAMQFLHRARQGLIQRRTQVGNQIRGVLYEFGIIIPLGLKWVRSKVAELLGEGADMQLHPDVKAAIADLYEELKSLEARIKDYDKRLEVVYEQDERCKRLDDIPGVGPLTATAAVAVLGDGKQFESGRHCSAYLGLVPRQHSSGGKERLLGISKRGNVYLRTIMVQGAQSKLKAVRKRASLLGIDKLNKQEQWLNDLYIRRGVNRAAVALANKNARMIWALLTKGEKYSPMV